MLSICLWKEWREHRVTFLWLLAIALSVQTLQVLLLPEFWVGPQFLQYSLLVWTTIAMLLFSTSLVQSEDRREEQGFALLLPLAERHRFYAKVLMALILILGTLLLVGITLIPLIWLRDVDTAAGLPLGMRWLPIVLSLAFLLMGVAWWIPRSAVVHPLVLLLLALAASPFLFVFIQRSWARPSHLDLLLLVGLCLPFVAFLVARVSAMGRRRSAKASLSWVASSFCAPGGSGPPADRTRDPTLPLGTEGLRAALAPDQAHRRGRRRGPMNRELTILLWKEWRQQRTSLLFLLAWIPGLLFLGAFLFAPSTASGALGFLGAGVKGSLLIGLLAFTGELWVGEARTRGLSFSSRLPTSPLNPALAKWLWAAFVPLALGAYGLGVAWLALLAFSGDLLAGQFRIQEIGLVLLFFAISLGFWMLIPGTLAAFFVPILLDRHAWCRRWSYILLLTLFLLSSGSGVLNLSTAWSLDVTANNTRIDKALIGHGDRYALLSLWNDNVDSNYLVDLESKQWRLVGKNYVRRNKRSRMQRVMGIPARRSWSGSGPGTDPTSLSTSTLLVEYISDTERRSDNRVLDLAEGRLWEPGALTRDSLVAGFDRSIQRASEAYQPDGRKVWVSAQGKIQYEGPDGTPVVWDSAKRISSGDVRGHGLRVLSRGLPRASSIPHASSSSLSPT